MLPRPDQEFLIPGGHPRRSHPVLFCYATKLAVYLLYFGLLLLDANSVSLCLVTVLLSLADFWCTQNIHGFELLGLSWYLSPGGGLSYISRPDPFVPNTSDSNAF
jgi:hypothetical protein